MVRLKKTMFREYDLRGRVSKDELNQGSCQLIGKGFASFLNKHNVNQVLVGFDARDYSEGLKNALISGMVSSD